MKSLQNLQSLKYTVLYVCHIFPSVLSGILCILPFRIHGRSIQTVCHCQHRTFLYCQLSAVWRISEKDLKKWIRWHLKLYFSYLKSGAYSCLARRKTMFTFGKGKINISNPFKIKKNTYLYCKTWECILYQTICFQIRVWNAFFIWNTIFVLKFDERFSLFARPSWPISVFD